MVRRHPLPPQWLFSDERLTVGIVRLAATLPPGSGIVLRHDSLAPGARWRLLRRLMRVARARGLTDTARRARRTSRAAGAPMAFTFASMTRAARRRRTGWA